MNGVQIAQETARYSDNLLSVFCDFNEEFIWNKVSGVSNTGVIENNSQERYGGERSIKIPFINTGECIFNAGGIQMKRATLKAGLYLLSYRFFKDNNDAEIVVKVQMYVDGTLFPQNEIIQTLSTDNGFVNGEWNTFYQEITLTGLSNVDFAFSVQSNITGVNLYIDGLKLEINDRNLNVPSIYSQSIVPTAEGEFNITIPAILVGGSVVVEFVLPNAKLGTDYIVMKYPNSLITQGLLVGTPTLTADGIGKFIIFNPTGSNSTAINDAIFKFKVVK